MNKFLAGLEISRETRRAFRIALKDKEELGAEIKVKITGNSSVCLLAEKCC